MTQNSKAKTETSAAFDSTPNIKFQHHPYQFSWNPKNSSCHNSSQNSLIFKPLSPFSPPRMDNGTDQTDQQGKQMVG